MTGPLPGTPEALRRFEPLAEIYARCRPSYPAELIDWIAATYDVAPPADVLDVGCGTGFATRLFTARGYSVVGVDPSPQMLEQARRAGGGARYDIGESTATGRPTASADLIVSGQAFHWFDLGPTLDEYRRVLRPGGACAAFWNHRTDETPFVREYEALMCEFVPGHAERRDTLKELVADIRADRRVTEVRDATFPNAQRLDRESLEGRVFSYSHVHHGVERKAELRAAVGDLFDRHQQGGIVELCYGCLVIGWRFAEDA